MRISVATLCMLASMGDDDAADLLWLHGYGPLEEGEEAWSRNGGVLVWIWPDPRTCMPSLFC